MRKLILPTLVFASLAIILGNGVYSSAQSANRDNKNGQSKENNAGPWVLEGRTQCIANRKGIIAPVVLHPVTEVKVSVGDTVKKGQALVLIDSDEPEADKRMKQAILQNAKVAKLEAKRYLESLEKLQILGAVSEQRIHDARATAKKTEADELTAKAALDGSMAELEHYTVEAPIDGVINRLDVHPGMVSRPGTTVWGEILDLREIDVRIQLSLAQVEIVKNGDEVEVLKDKSNQIYRTGKVVFIGLQANADNGKIPALVRLANPDGKLRCEVPVQVRFPHDSKAQLSAH